MPFREQSVSVVIGSASWLSRAVEEAPSKRPGTVVTKYSSQLDVAGEWAGAFFETLGTIDHLLLTAEAAMVANQWITGAVLPLRARRERFAADDYSLEAFRFRQDRPPTATCPE